MAAFEDNNPFASPSSPTSSRANSYAPFGSYTFSPGPSVPAHGAHASFDSSAALRPTTSSSDDAPAYNYRATTTNSDISVDVPGADNNTSSPATQREKDGETCCKIDEVLVKNPEMRIVITEAGKASDGGANFIAYTIEVGVRCRGGLFGDLFVLCWGQRLMMGLGNDVATTVFGIRVFERGFSTVISNTDYPAHSGETFYVYDISRCA
jgi:hypothetical protein